MYGYMLPNLSPSLKECNLVDIGAIRCWGKKRDAASLFKNGVRNVLECVKTIVAVTTARIGVKGTIQRLTRNCALAY